jgi:hypothetical protein
VKGSIDRQRAAPAEGPARAEFLIRTEQQAQAGCNDVGILRGRLVLDRGQDGAPGKLRRASVIRLSPAGGVKDRRPARGCGRNDQGEIRRAAFGLPARVDFLQPGQAVGKVVEPGNFVQLS